MSLVPVPLTEEEVDRYYEGMSNASLWPLYHDVVEKPEYHRTWWDTYVQVNKRFAERAAAVAAEGAIVWVHDYQLQLVPALLRQSRPDLTIGFFLHIPFPPYELFTQLPWRSAIVEGLLGADLVGFQRPAAAANFVQLAKRLHDLPARGQVDRVRRPDGRRPRLPHLHRRRRPSTSWPARRRCSPAPRRSARSSATRRRSSWASTGWTTPRASACAWPRSRSCSRTASSRRRTRCSSRWPRPAASASSTTCTCGRRSSSRSATSTAIFGSMAGPAVHYFNQSMPREELAALYRAADVMLVTPYRDGMNLVAKEYVAARGDLGGRARPLGVRRRGRGAQAGVPGQPARHRRREEPAGPGAAHGPGRGRQADAGDAPAPGRRTTSSTGRTPSSTPCAARRRASRPAGRPAARPHGWRATGTGPRDDARSRPTWTRRWRPSRSGGRCSWPATTTACSPRCGTTRRRRASRPAPPTRSPRLSAGGRRHGRAGQRPRRRRPAGRRAA